MKKLFLIITAMIGICAIMPTVKAESNATSAEGHSCIIANYGAVGDYRAWDSNGTKSISLRVYSHENSCYSYYAYIDGGKEPYDIRENPDYDSNKTSYNTPIYKKYTHYVRYQDVNYYFSI